MIEDYSLDRKDRKQTTQVFQQTTLTTITNHNNLNLPSFKNSKFSGMPHDNIYSKLRQSPPFPISRKANRNGIVHNSGIFNTNHSYQHYENIDIENTSNGVKGDDNGNTTKENIILTGNRDCIGNKKTCIETYDINQQNQQKHRENFVKGKDSFCREKDYNYSYRIKGRFSVLSSDNLHNNDQYYNNVDEVNNDSIDEGNRQNFEHQKKIVDGFLYAACRDSKGQNNIRHSSVRNSRNFENSHNQNQQQHQLQAQKIHMMHTRSNSQQCHNFNANDQIYKTTSDGQDYY